MGDISDRHIFLSLLDTLILRLNTSPLVSFTQAEFEVINVILYHNGVAELTDRDMNTLREGNLVGHTHESIDAQFRLLSQLFDIQTRRVKSDSFDTEENEDTEEMSDSDELPDLIQSYSDATPDLIRTN